MEPLTGLLAAMALAGLASGVHCVAMCGGIVSAFGTRHVIPVRPSTPPGRHILARQLAFNAGRVASYTAAGAAAGWAGSAAAYTAGVLPAQTVLYVLANLMLVAVGLYLAGARQLLAPLESLGAPLWRRLQPIATRQLAVPGLRAALVMGLAWGWLPCGLVYGALAAAAFTASPVSGAAAMLAFGLGTLPTLLATGLAAARLHRWSGRRAVRIGAGSVVAAFGAFGLAHASGLAASVQRALHAL